MSESDVLQGLFNAIQAVLTIVTLFLGIVSGYLAALYFFLAQAPFFLRLLAFALLSIALVFLGGTALVVQTMQEGLLAAWTKLRSPVIAAVDLRNPVPLPQMAGFSSQQELGVAIGWAVGVAVYAALFYMTFIYRWPKADQRHERSP